MPRAKITVTLLQAPLRPSSVEDPPVKAPRAEEEEVLVVEAVEELDVVEVPRRPLRREVRDELLEVVLVPVPVPVPVLPRRVPREAWRR